MPVPVQEPEPEPEPRSNIAKLWVLSTISVLTLLGNLTILALLLARRGKVRLFSQTDSQQTGVL